MPNPYVNKVTVNNATIIDLTNDTAIASDVAAGKYFHLSTGERVVGTASGGGGDSYTLTTIVPQQTFTPQELSGSYQTTVTYTAGLEDGEYYLVTYDGDEYVCTCGLYWGSDNIAGNDNLFFGNRDVNPYPFGIDYAPSTPEFAVATYDLNQHTIKVEHLEFVDEPQNIATILGTYNASAKALALSTDGNIASWWGGVGYELIGDVQWSAAISSAANWPLTPTTTAQNLTWVTSYTATANANATIDRIGKGYHGVTETLDFGTYNYVVFEDAFVHYEYTSPEASLGKVHTIYDGFTAVYHWGARPRVASGAIVRPDATHYGTYASCAYTAALIGYRTAAGTLQLANNATYGVGMAAIAPAMNSSSSVKPSYFNVRTPTCSIRAHNTYMPVASYGSLDMDATTVNYRCRIYRVPAEYGAYTTINDRLLDMLQQETFPVEV